LDIAVLVALVPPWWKSNGIGACRLCSVAQIDQLNIQSLLLLPLKSEHLLSLRISVTPLERLVNISSELCL
jgi:hypothetical protein